MNFPSSFGCNNVNENGLNGLKNKKKAPISINSNPYPGKFNFNHQNISKIATSYKDTGNKIQNVDKRNKCNHKMNTETNLLFNNFLSVNSHISQVSNASSSSKNSINLLTSRIIPAKNTSAFILKTDNILREITSKKASKDKNISVKLNLNENLKSKTKTTLFQSKTLRPKSNEDLNLSKRLNKSKNGIKCTQGNKSLVLGKQMKKKKNVSHIISQIPKEGKSITSFKSMNKQVIQRPSITIHHIYNNELQKNNTVLTTNNLQSIPTMANENNITDINNKPISVNKREFSTDSNITLTRENSKSNKIINHTKDNKSLCINSFELNKLINNNNNNNNESKIKNKISLKNIIPRNTKINLNLNQLLKDIKIIKKDTRNKTQYQSIYRDNNASNNEDNLKSLKAEESKDRNSNIKSDKDISNKLFKDEEYLNNASLPIDQFDDLNEIVRKIRFDEIDLNKENIFTIEKNLEYKVYSKKFEQYFRKNISKNFNLNRRSNSKSSERKYFHSSSLSTQDNSNKKSLATPLY